MTTIAYKDGILAADTRLVVRDTPLYCTKIRQLRKDFIIACAGNTDDEFIATRFFSNPDWRGAEFPELKKKNNFYCIFLDKRIPYFCSGSLFPCPIETPFYAIGSGMDYALLAMQLGFSAIQAVSFASMLDINTNDEVEIYDAQLQKIFRRQELKEVLRQQGINSPQDLLPEKKETT